MARLEHAATLANKSLLWWYNIADLCRWCQIRTVLQRTSTRKRNAALCSGAVARIKTCYGSFPELHQQGLERGVLRHCRQWLSQKARCSRAGLCVHSSLCCWNL
jgi:hypothetical protein